MNHSINKFASQATSAISLATLALFPLFFLPTTTNFFETNKLFLLVIATALLLIVWGIKTLATKSLKLELTVFSLPLLAYGLVHFASSFIMTPKSPVDALMNRGSLFLVLSLFVTIVGTMVDNRKYVRQAVYTLIGSATVLSILSIFQALGLGLSGLINQLAGTNLSASLAFTPAGSPIALLTFLAPLTLLTLFLAFTKTDISEKVSLFILSAFMAAGFVVVSIYSFPGKDTAPIFLPLRVGYAVAVETLKNPKTALFGVGTNSFTVAYNQYRPALMNTTEYWGVRFGVSSNEIFQMFTTVGLLGLACFIWLFITMVKNSKTEVRSTQLKALKIIGFGIMLLFFLIPLPYLVFFLFWIILLLWGLQLKFSGSVKTIDLSVDREANTPQTMKLIGVFAPAIILIIMAGASLFFAAKGYAAEMTFKRALDAAAKNDGIKTYNLQRQAILENPYLPRYRRAYAATNLALANSLAANKDIKEEDKKNIAQLIQQAIREAKIAVSLEPQNVANWESLALIYRSLINAAEGADQWTIAALSQAIQTDPTNPSLRIDLGGIYYSLARYDQAIRLFQQAAELKPDYANAYYNLSHSYLQKKDVPAAFDYMRQTLSLAKADSADYAKAKSELEELSKQLPKAEQPKAQAETRETAPPVTELQTPSPAASPSTALDLPPGSGPENATQTNP